jgi:hypothetical protein
MNRTFISLSVSLLASNAMAECPPEADQFQRVADIAAQAVDIIDANRVDWDSLVLDSETRRAAYVHVKDELLAYLPHLKTWTDSAPIAIGAVALCRSGETLDSSELAGIVKGITAGKAMVEAGYGYIEAVSAANALE